MAALVPLGFERLQPSLRRGYCDVEALEQDAILVLPANLGSVREQGTELVEAEVVVGVRERTEEVDDRR